MRKKLTPNFWELKRGCLNYPASAALFASHAPAPAALSGLPSRFRVWGSGFRVRAYRIWGSGFRVRA